MCRVKYELKTKAKTSFTSYPNTMLLSRIVLFLDLNTKAMTFIRIFKTIPDFYYDKFITINNRKRINDFVRKPSDSFFELKLGDQDKSWAPYIVCKIFKEHLLQWRLRVLELLLSLTFRLFGTRHKITSKTITSIQMTITGLNKTERKYAEYRFY